MHESWSLFSGIKPTATIYTSFSEHTPVLPTTKPSAWNHFWPWYVRIIQIGQLQPTRLSQKPRFLHRSHPYPSSSIITTTTMVVGIASVMRYNLIILAVDRCFSIHSIQLQPSSGHLPGRSGVKKCGALQTTNQSTTFLDQIDLDGKHLLQLSITKTASTCFHHQRSVHRLFQAPELVSTRHHRWIRSG